MDRQIILEKLESLRRCLKRVRDKCPSSAEALSKDPDAQDIVSVNLTRAVQLAVDIAAHLIARTDHPAPDSMGEVFEVLGKTGIIDDDLVSRLKGAVGFRNIAIHSYREIDWNITFSICSDRLADFERFASAVVAAVESPDP